MYKLNIKRNGIFVMSKYFDARKEAIKVRDNYNRSFNCDGYVATLQPTKVELTFHHYALERGYIRKNEGRDEYYNGKFGVGIKRHTPNWVTKKNEPHKFHSNNYHLVEYYVET